MGLLGDAWDAVTGAGGYLGTLIEKAKKAAKKAAQKAKDAAKEAVETVVEAAEEAAEDVVSSFTDLADDLADTWSDVWRDVKGAFQAGVLQGLVMLVGGAVAGLIASFGNVVDFIYNLAGAALGGFVSLVGAFVGGLLQVAITVLSLGYLSDLAREIGGLIAELGRALGEVVQLVFDVFGDVIERVYDTVARIVLALSRWLQCGVGKTFGRRRERKSIPVDHFFVLMLENRSFDHMLGLSEVSGVNGLMPDPLAHTNPRDGGGLIPAQAGARLALRVDPPHEFVDVQRQIHTKPPMQGFVKTFQEKVEHVDTWEDAAEAMYSFSRQSLPILHQLASEFAVCDAWFSSLPGPTIPNRLFAMAGTSGGMASQPKSEFIADAMTTGGFEFEHGSLFDLLDQQCLGWRVYAGDLTPLVKLLKGPVAQDVAERGKRFRSLEDLQNDLMPRSGADFPALTWIEPNYGAFATDFKGGNSQHPLDSVVPGEELVKTIYEALRNSWFWERSAFIVVYDEHGGFFDHVVPPSAEPPGDDADYRHWAAEEEAKRFDFTRLGVRVLAIVVSPYIEKGTVFHTTVDHTTICKTLEDRFGRTNTRLAVTERQKQVVSLAGLFTRESPRIDAPTALAAPYEG